MFDAHDRCKQPLEVEGRSVIMLRFFFNLVLPLTFFILEIRLPLPEVFDITAFVPNLVDVPNPKEAELRFDEIGCFPIPDLLPYVPGLEIIKVKQS